MGLPPYFATTTLRTLLADTGSAADEIVARARGVHIELQIGGDPAGRLMGRTFVELAARTFGSLRVMSSSRDLVDALQARARAVNPRLELEAKPDSRTVTVALGCDDSSEIRYWARGWWLGPTPQSDIDPRSVQLGAVAAGAIAFNECYRAAFADILRPGQRVPTPGWSLRDWSMREPDTEDERAVPVLPLGEAALVGCGAIGQGVAFALAQFGRIDGLLDLVDPQTLSSSNLQRYVGSLPADAIHAAHKVVLAERQLRGVPGLTLRQWAGADWARYQSQSAEVPPLVITALDTAEDRRVVQAALPRWIANGWTRSSESGGGLHDFSGSDQCLVCTYLPRDPGESTTDLALLAGGLGLTPLRVTYLLAGASLQREDLRSAERHHRLAAGCLDRWRGESVRSLFGQLCGVADVRPDLRAHYVVPLPQASLLAAVFVVAQVAKLVLGMSVGTRPIEISLRDGPGIYWEQPPARKVDHPAPCVCKDSDYLEAFAHKWAMATAE